MTEQTLIPLGRYRHYKGKDYSVLGFATHSETQETMVLYVPLYGEGGYWVRPLSMFTELVQTSPDHEVGHTNGDSQLKPRFELISE